VAEAGAAAGSGIVDMAAVAAAAVQVAQILLQLNAVRNVVLVVENHTNLTLNKTQDEHAHGGFALPPDAQIPPQKADVFGSQSKGASVMTGTEGSIVYSGDGLTLNVSWDNPWAGDNSCDAFISGENACRYRIIHECGVGQTGAGMKYQLFERTPPSLAEALRNHESMNIYRHTNIRAVATTLGLAPPFSICQVIGKLLP
jgi:hypothetical protein